MGLRGRPSCPPPAAVSFSVLVFSPVLRTTRSRFSRCPVFLSLPRTMLLSLSSRCWSHTRYCMAYMIPWFAWSSLRPQRFRKVASNRCLPQLTGWPVTTTEPIVLGCGRGVLLLSGMTLRKRVRSRPSVFAIDHKHL